MRIYSFVNLRRAPQIVSAWLMLILALFVAADAFAAGDLNLFGPKRYERLQGKPWLFTDNFNSCTNSAGQALLRVQNGAGKESSLSSALITLNGANVLVEADFKNQAALLERTVTLRPGINTIGAQLKSGGRIETPFLIVTVVGLGCDSTSPVISGPQPADGALLSNSRPAISASYADNSGGAGVDTSSVRLVLDGGDITSSCTVGVTSVSCMPASPLSEGEHSVALAVSDLLQNPATLGWSFTTDTVAPRVAVTSPLNTQYLSGRSVTVSGTVDDPKAMVTVNGKAATISGATFSVVDVPLTEGDNTLTAVAVDPATNRAESAIKVMVDTTLPQVTVTTPIDGSFTGSSTISVSGAVSEPPVSVLVNGRPATIMGKDFTLADFLLAEGLNTLTVEAADPVGHKGTAIVTVNLDTVSPAISVGSPRDGLLTRASLLTVNGTISEPVTSLTVNGQPATVNDFSFTSALALSEGPNTIVLEAKDRAANKGTATIAVTLDSTPPTAPVLESLTTSTNAPQAKVSGSAEPDSNVALYNGSDRVATIVTHQDGRFSFPEMVLHEGENSFSATALDPAGNESAPSAPVRVVLDTKAPVVGIAAPLDKAILNTPVIKVSGTIDDPAAAVTVNGLATLNSGGTWSLDNFTLQEGSNTLLVEAKDPAGNKGSATVTVTLDTIAPQFSVIGPADGALLSSGQITFGAGASEPVASVTVNGVAATAGASGYTLPVTLSEGNNSLTVIATDKAGNSTTATYNVTLDSIPPVITVTAPVAGTIVNTSEVTITGTVSEPLADLTVNGASTPLNGLSFEYVMALAEGENSALIVATDLAGNVATTTLIIRRDSTPPTVVIVTPLPGFITKSGTVRVGGTVDDAEAAVTVNGALVTITSSAFGFDYSLSDGDNIITVEANDNAGNRGRASVMVTLDAVPPQLILSAPAEAVAGANVAINLTASDNRGLALVELKADGVPIWSLGDGPAISEAVTYRLSPALSAGAVVTLQARGIDAAGNEGTAAATIGISRAASGPGYLQGKALDDSRGLRLEGAAVTITDATGIIHELTTAADGGWFLETPSGNGLVKIGKPGFTTVERQVSVIPEKNINVLDARLTKIDDTRNPVDASGGTVKMGLLHSNPDPRSPYLVELTVPAGALGSSTDLRLTPVSNQGLAGLLPPGWSPLAAVDIRALDPATGATLATTFTAPAALELPLPGSVTIDRAAPPVLARYDETAHSWLVVESAAIDSASATAEITSSGQYALVIADPAPNGPAAAVAGQALPAASLQPPDFSLMSATGRVVPQAAPPKAGLRAAGEVVLAAGDGLAPTFTSGLVLSGSITEKFDLKSGDRVETPVYSQDLILYRYPCVTSIGAGAVTPLTSNGGELRTTFPVSPSREYTIVDLLLGKVGIEILRPDTSETGVMVGADGGRLVDGDGNILAIPQGALALTTPVSTRTATPASGIVGSDFTLVRAVELNLTRQTLVQPATLAIPAPTGLDGALPLIVAKQIDVKGVARLKLVALARQSGTLITSEPLTQMLTNATTQLNSSGVYYFLQAKAPIGFVTGTVTDSGSAPFTGAFVKTDKGSLVDLAASNGKYLLAAPVAPFTATATDLYKGDEITANSAITAASQAVTVDLRIEKIPPTVISDSPANGSVNVQPTVPVIVTFSKAMDQATINATTLKLSDSAGTTVPGSLTFSIDNRTVTFYPADAFKQETSYGVTISGSVKDLQGYPLGSDTTSTFTIRKTTPPPMPAAGAISATFPDLEGFITITATQGSASPSDTVLLINDTTGEITSLKPANSGSFTGKIRAQLGDEIKVVLMDYSGNQTTISYLTFKGPDGSYLVTAKGGKVEGEGGSILEIPEGALSGPTVIKLTAIPEVGLPHPTPTPGKYLSAFNLDTGGIPFQKEVHLSIPVPDGFDVKTPVFVTKPGTINNPDGTQEQVYEVIDSTKIINGRITTASPPFEGVMTFGSYAFTAFPDVSIGVVSGYTYQDMDGSNTFDPLMDKSVRGAVVRNAAAGNYISYTRSNGFYAGMLTLYGNVGAPERRYTVTATHPLTMRQESVTGYLHADGLWSYNIARVNFKLADKDTVLPDNTPPAIDVSLAIAPSHAATNRIIAGTVRTDIPLSLSVIVTDQQLEWATLSASFTAPGGSPVPIPSVIKPSGSGKISTPEGKVLTRYLYTPEFTAIDDTTSLYLTPWQEGNYTFIVTAKDLSNNRSSRTLTIRAVPPGTSLGSGIEGPPTVDSVIPAADSKDIMVTAPVTVWFSEPVENVSDSTFVLLDTVTGKKVPATVSSGLEGGRMQATLTPQGNLYYARKYEVRLTNTINDTYANSSGGKLNLASYSSFFTTKVPKGYDLVTEQQFTGGRDIVLYTFTAENGESTTYAYIMAGDKGWRIVDVTDPTAPVVIHSATADCNTLIRDDCRLAPPEYNYRSVAINPDTKIMAITENINYSDGNQYGYARFYDLSEMPGFPPIVGREKLAEAWSGIPGRVAMHGNYAYVATTNVGLQIIGVKQAIADSGNGLSDGSNIIGIYNSIAEGYGQPSDIITYGAAKALLTTNSGNLLVLDINQPLPQFLAKYRSTPHRITRTGVAPDYSYLDQYGNQQVDDIAIVGTLEGQVLTINLTDPYDPKYIATAKGKDGTDLTTSVREISVSKESGLAFITTVNSIQVIDFKDPKNPRLLTEIATLPDASGAIDRYGDPIMQPIGTIPAIVEKGGWVYLASQGQGLKVVDLDPAIINVTPAKIFILLNNADKASKDYGFTYEIILEPGANNEFENPRIMLFKNGAKIREWTDVQPGKAMTLIGQDTPLDINSIYHAQVLVYDKKQGVDIPSSKVPITTRNLFHTSHLKIQTLATIPTPPDYCTTKGAGQVQLLLNLTNRRRLSRRRTGYRRPIFGTEQVWRRATRQVLKDL